MTDISVIVLVGREERHIARCLEKLAALSPRQVFVVESQHGDRTHEVAVETGRRLKFEVRSLKFEVRSSKSDSSKFEVSSLKCDSLKFEVSSSKSDTRLYTVFHPWPGLQAKQFNWAIDNLPIEGEWVLRLDADEYLTDETVERMKKGLGVRGEKLENGVGGGKKLEDGVGGGEGKTQLAYTLELKRKFCGGEIRHATTGIRQVRLFRRGCARYDEGLMDERLVVDSSKFEVGSSKYEVGGSTRSPASQLQTSNFKLQTPSCITDFEGAFYDDSLMPMDEWREKHRGYAKREAAQAIESLKTGVWTDPRKASYYKLPRYLRAFAYFCIRYFLKGGILDGRAGWQWNFWQGLWYRWLVDKEIARMGK